MARTAIAVLESPEAEARVRAGLAAHAPLELITVIAAVERDDRDGLERPGLAEALRRIAAGEASVLLVARLADAATSPDDLVALLDWLALAHADLIVLDLGLDSGSSEGRRAVALLRELDRLGGEHADARAPRGRPGLAARAPELREQIAAMRARGLSLQAIADALDADGVPTLRGGARWRPSAVQAALGYRRPAPPPPGGRLPPPPGPLPPGLSRGPGPPDHGPPPRSPRDRRRGR